MVVVAVVDRKARLDASRDAQQVAAASIAPKRESDGEESDVTMHCHGDGVVF